jgi:hypothetical protein
VVLAGARLAGVSETWRGPAWGVTGAALVWACVGLLLAE